MYLTELNRSFSELDRKIVHYINEVKGQMLLQARQLALLTCKYKLGFEFTHPKYGLGFIKDIEVNLNKEDFMSFDSDIILYDEDYYEPYYMYVVDYYTGYNVYGHRVTELEIDSWMK